MENMENMDTIGTAGFGRFLGGAAHSDRWCAATTGVAHLWTGHALNETVRIPGFIGGTPVLDVESGAAGAFLVGEWSIDLEDANATGIFNRRDWIRDGIEDGNVTPADFSAQRILHSVTGRASVVLTRHLQPRGIGADSDYRGPEAQLLIVDRTDASLRGVLLEGDDLMIPLFDVAGDVIATYDGDSITIWTLAGEPADPWDPDEPIGALALDQRGASLAVVTHSGRVVVSSLDGTDASAWDAHDATCDLVVWNRDGSMLATASRTGEVGVWDRDGRRRRVRSCPRSGA